jgi:vacuolar-type H+-ATPase subunit D/Vma8
MTYVRITEEAFNLLISKIDKLSERVKALEVSAVGEETVTIDAIDIEHLAE